MEQIKDDWTQQQQHANDDVLQSFFPKPLMEAAQKAMADVDACIAEVPVVLTDGWEGDFKGVLCRVTAAVQSGGKQCKGGQHDPDGSRHGQALKGVHFLLGYPGH